MGIAFSQKSIEDMNKEYIRRPHHAGAWYSDDPAELDAILSKYMANATTESTTTDHGESTNTTKTSDQASDEIPRGIIAPHAGFSYSGSTAAHAYVGLKEAFDRGTVHTVCVIHPSHHVYLDGCAVSCASMIVTPLLSFPTNSELREELLLTNEFSLMNQQTDEEEHSGEMQYPFIAKAYLDSKQSSVYGGKCSVHVLPIMVGAISYSKEERYGKLLSPILARQNIFTVISSDFCHWGSRFQYAPRPSPSASPRQEIYQFIEWLDRLGMDEIAAQEPGAFAIYLKKYKNTICGRHPIGVWLQSLKFNNESGVEKMKLRFVQYAQSSPARSMNDSSVSYASCIATKVTQ